MSIQATKRARPAGLTCPYCRDHVQPTDDLSTCADCETAYHADCLSELGRCGTLGCSGLEAPNRGCLRCLHPITDQDLVLRCDGCERLYHRDCFIPGARCTATKCEGVVEFVKVPGHVTTPRPENPDHDRCIASDCRRPRTGVGWTFLGRGVHDMCRDHGSSRRELYGRLVLFMPLVLALPFVSPTQIGKLLILGLVLALPFLIDALRIQRSPLPPRSPTNPPIES